MERITGSRECPSFPPTPGTPIVFAARKGFPASRAGVRESGQDPDDPDGRTRACWHHREAAECTAYGVKLELDREARRLTSIGIDLLVWMHARKTLDVVPQRPFLERFEPSRRWENGATPPLGLARGAVLYHLPLGPDHGTAAELFEGSRMRPRICPAEVEWLEAERRARFSFFEVAEIGPRGVLLRDWFRALSGRRDVLVRRDEFDRASESLLPGHTVFARIVPFRRQHYVNLMQLETSIRAGVDPARPPMEVWSSPHDLRDRSGMVHALFETWERETKTARTKR